METDAAHLTPLNRGGEEFHPEIADRFRHTRSVDRTVKLDRVQSGSTVDTESVEIYEKDEVAVAVLRTPNGGVSSDAAWWLLPDNVPELIEDFVAENYFVVSYVDDDLRDPETFTEVSDG